MLTARTGTKVLAPELPPSCVARPRLSRVLAKAGHHPLVLVSAGAGSGKTTMLSAWARSTSGPTAWLSLDPADNDPTRFWSVVAQSLLAAGLIDDLSAFDRLQHGDGQLGTFFQAFNDAMTTPSDRTLVIDDAHLLTDPVVLAELDALIRYDSPYLRLVLGARTDPLLPLHRYRLAGLIHEIRADELAMNRAEASELLQLHGINLSGADLGALTRRTEGWVAGLQLSAMRMAGSRHPERFITQLALDQGSISEYLIEEVLARQPGLGRELLVRTSFLDELDGSLAAAVTGIDDAPQLLWDMARSNAFVLPLNGGQGSFRCHQLLSETLRYLLRLESPELQRELRSRAAGWYEKQGDTASALRLALEAQDFGHAASILIHGGLANAYVDRLSLQTAGIDGINRLPELEALTGDRLADVRVAQAAVAVICEEPAAATEYLASGRLADRNPDVQTAAALVTVISAQQRNAVVELDAAAAKMVSQVPPLPGIVDVPGLRAAVRVAQAQTHFWEARSAHGIEGLLLTGLAEARESAALAIEMEALDLLQLMSVLTGRIGHARDYDAQVHQLLRRWPHLQLSNTHHLAHAYSAFLRAEFGHAERALRRAEGSPGHTADQSTRAATVLLRIEVGLSGGRLADAHSLLRSSEELAGPLPARLDRSRVLIAAALERELGRPNAAVRLLRASDYSAKDPFIATAISHALLRQGDDQAASQALRPVLVGVEPSPPLPLLIEALLLSAQIAEAAGDDARAATEVLRATELAADGIIQPFAATYGPLSALLARHTEIRSAWPADPRLTVEQPHDADRSSSGRLAEPLTDREVTVLRRLATTMTAAEIADELCVSINTVKTHIAGIYRKLPAAGRRDAVLRARQLELL